MIVVALLASFILGQGGASRASQMLGTNPTEQDPALLPGLHPACTTQPSWTPRQHGSHLPSGMLYSSSSSLPKREARGDLVKFAYSKARHALYPGVSPARGGVDLARVRGSGAVRGGSFLSKVVGQALAWSQENCLLHCWYLFCVAISHTCGVELLAEVSSSDHLLVFLVQIAPCLEDTSGQQCNGVEGETLQKRQDPPHGIHPHTNRRLPGNLSSSFTHGSRVFHGSHISGFSILQCRLWVEHPELKKGHQE